MLTSCSKPSHHYQGYIEAENIYLASPYSGKLVKALVCRGMKVKKNDLLFVLDPKPQQFAIRQQHALYQQAQSLLMDIIKPKRKQEQEAIAAQIEQASAQAALAMLRVKRNQILFEKHVAPKDTLDEALEHLHEFNGLKAEYEANLALAKLGARPDQIIAQTFEVASLYSKWKEQVWDLEQKKITAPSDGIIFDTYYKRGEYVAAEKPVATLLTHENTRIEFFVPLQGLSDLSVGATIHFSYENDSKNHTAVISYISPEAEYMPPLVYSRNNSDKIVFRIKAQVGKSERLIPGEPVVVTVEPKHA